MFTKILEGLLYGIFFIISGVLTIFSMWLCYFFFNYFGFLG